MLTNTITTMTITSTRPTTSLAPVFPAPAQPRPRPAFLDEIQVRAAEASATLQAAEILGEKERKKKTNALNPLAELMREQNIALHDLGLKHRRIILQLLLDNSWDIHRAEIQLLNNGIMEIGNNNLESRESTAWNPNELQSITRTDVRSSKTGIGGRGAGLVTNFDGIDWI